MISSTRSSESASRSSWNEASSVIWFSSTPSCSTSTSLTLSATSSREAAISLSYLPFVQWPGRTADATTLPRGRCNPLDEPGGDARDDLLRGALRGERYRVRDRRPRAVPVGDHGQAAKPEEIGAAVGLGIEPLAQLPGCGSDQQPAGFPARRRRNLRAKRLEECLDGALHQLQRHVSGESVADDDVGRVRQELTPLHVPDEVEAALFEQGVRLANESVPLLRLLADGEERDGRRRDPEDLGREDRAHVPELNEVLGARIRIRACVDEDGRPTERWKGNRDRRPVHVRKTADLEQPGGE